MSDTRLTLSQGQLTAFLACQRRFQLRYLRRLPWPPLPQEVATETAVARGQQFHQLLQRHFLGLAPQAAAITDPLLRRWWAAFQNSGLPAHGGEPLAEVTLTVPIGDHLLRGRFDLVVINLEPPGVHIYDWKTGRPRPAADLQGDWQTRLYLALLAAGGHALHPKLAELAAEQVAFTYWYVGDPETPRTIHYSAAAHRQNWADLQQLVAQIDAQLEQTEWPLTEDWSLCVTCAYQVYCRRQQANVPTGAAALSAGDDDERVSAIPLEPELP